MFKHECFDLHIIRQTNLELGTGAGGLLGVTSGGRLNEVNLTPEHNHFSVRKKEMCDFIVATKFGRLRYGNWESEQKIDGTVQILG